MNLDRGTLLYQTGRFDLAEQEFRAALAVEPMHARARAMLALCFLHRDKLDDAETEARQAIQLEPDTPFTYYVLASVLRQRVRLNEAEAAINRAIELDPLNPDYNGALADILMQQLRWADAVAAADRGLQSNPEHPACVAARGMALVKLGRRDEASATIEGALARNPHSALNHANQGWALLHRGEHKAALEHFREALRINPEMKWAKAGIVEAMKARNPVYRVMLRYFLFMSRLNRRAQIGVVIGGLVAYNALRAGAATNPTIALVAVPLMVLYFLFVILSWLAAPFFNLMLRIDKFGRYALSPDQTSASNYLGGCLALAVLFAIAWVIRRDERLLVAAIMAALIMIPVTTIFRCDRGWPRHVMTAYTAALALIGVAAGVLMALPSSPNVDQAAQNMIGVFLGGVILSQFVGNWLAVTRAKR